MSCTDMGGGGSKKASNVTPEGLPPILLLQKIFPCQTPLLTTGPVRVPVYPRIIQPITSSCGNQWAPFPLNTTKPPCYHSWHFIPFLSATPMQPCVVRSGLLPSTVSACECAVISLICPVPRRWLQWSVLDPRHSIPPSPMG